jgi:hypothetical protein
MEKPKQRKQHKATEPRTGNQSPSSGKVKAPTKHQTPKSLAVLQGLLVCVAFFFLSSYLITDTWLWGYNGKYVNRHHWFPVTQLNP